jgi:hypothetical protein
MPNRLLLVPQKPNATKPLSLSSLACLVVATGCLLSAGCGTGDYETLMKSRMGALNTSAPFKQLFGASELPGTPVKVRVPQSFKASYAENSPHPDDPAGINPQRLQPPFVNLPGFKLCYEGTVQGVDGILPYYCYLSAFEAGSGQATAIEGEIRAALNKEFASNVAWEDVDATTPTGASIPWKKISVAGEMLFDVHSGDNRADNAEYKKIPGKFELWSYQANGWMVLVGWREPDAISTASDLSTLAPLTAGSIEVGNAAPPPAGQ